MSKVVRLSDDVLEKLDKVIDSFKPIYCDDYETWYLIFDKVDLNRFLSIVLTYYIEKHDIK